MLLLSLLWLTVLIPCGDNEDGKSHSAAPSTVVGDLDRSMLHLPLRVWPSCLQRSSLILEVGDGEWGPVFQALYCSFSGFFFSGSFQFSLFFSFFILFCFSLSPHFSYPSLPTAFQGPTSFHVIQISSFANSTWAQNQGSGWLGDLQIHGWDSTAGTAIFLKPWSKGNFTNEEVTELEELFRVYLVGFIRVIQDHVSEFQMKCECIFLIWVDSQLIFFFSLDSDYFSPPSHFTQLHARSSLE